MRKGLIITTLLLTLASCVRRPLEDPDFSTRIDVKVDITSDDYRRDVDTIIETARRIIRSAAA